MHEIWGKEYIGVSVRSEVRYQVISSSRLKIYTNQMMPRYENEEGDDCYLISKRSTLFIGVLY